MTTRRDFLRIAAYAGGAAGLTALASPSRGATVPRAGISLDILILGGTGFIGPHEVQYALDRGHRVTIFNRGRQSGLFGGSVEELVGNRDSKIDNGLEPLMGDRTWDVVIDNSGYVPRHVEDSVQLLKGRVGRYLYISTVAVYDTSKMAVISEDGPLLPLDDPTIEEVTWETYGPLKAECDRIVRSELGDAATVVRPSYIVGPGDTTDRFTYWVERIHRGGDVLAPCCPEAVIQWVDVRDLCPWVIELAERNEGGIYNAAGPSSDVTRAGLLWGIRATTDAPVRFWWPNQALLDELEIAPPMLDWNPRADGRSVVFANEASMRAGLDYRSLADSVTGTHEWWIAQPAERRAEPRRWIPEDKEDAAISVLRGAQT